MKIKITKSLVLCVLFCAVAVGQDRAEPGHPKHIVGGEDTMAGEFPFVAKIIYGGSQVGCTGSLIAENKVLTAAHCLDNYTAASISVAFGNSRNSGGFHQAVSIEKHPLYIGDHANEYDFAIIKFSPAVRNIKPVRILNEEAELKWVPEVAYGVIVGWGGTTAANNPPLPNTLQKVAVPIRREAGCAAELMRLRREGKDPQNPAITYKVLCAGEEGRAAAQGDSGGPLLVLTTDGWAQVGVLSQSTRNPFGSSERIVYFNTFFRTALEYEWIYPRPDAYRLYFAWSASGKGWKTDLILLNATEVDTEATVKINTSYDLTVPAQGLTEWTLPLPEPGGIFGIKREILSWSEVVVTSDEKLSGFLRLRHTDGSITSVSSTPLAPGFMLPVSARAERVGLAVFNPHPSQGANVRIELQNCSAFFWVMDPGENRGRFLDEVLFFEGCDMEGTLVVKETTGLEITVLALEVTDGNLVTLPAVVLE